MRPRSTLPRKADRRQKIWLLPAVVVIDELRSPVLEEYVVVPNPYEQFYAITVRRRYEHPLVRPLLAQSAISALAATG